MAMLADLVRVPRGVISVVSRLYFVREALLVELSLGGRPQTPDYCTAPVTLRK